MLEELAAKLDRMIELLEALLAAQQGGNGEATESEPEADEVEAEDEEPAPPARGRKGKASKVVAPVEDEEPTLDDAKAVMKAYMDATSVADMKALLTKYKVKKLSDLDPGKFPKIIAEAKKLMAAAGEDSGEEDDGEDGLS